MDTRFLTTFLEVVNTRHFGKAAENLYLTQSAVSARIKLLEEYFQATLFERHRNSIQLTPSGEKLLPYAKSVCETLSLARVDLQAACSNVLLIGATQLAGELALSHLLPKLKDICPGWVVRADVMSMEGLSRRLHERMIDVAISTEPLKSEDIQQSLLFKLPLGLFQVNYNGPIDSSAYIAIDWGPKVTDMIIHRHPRLRDAGTFTNVLHVAESLLQQQGGLAVLPIGDNPFWQGPAGAMLVEKIEDAQVTIYLNTMKSVRRAELSAIIENITSSLTLTE